MADREVEQAVLAVFEAVLGEQGDGRLQSVGPTDELEAAGLPRDLQTLATKVDRLVTEAPAASPSTSVGNVSPSQSAGSEEYEPSVSHTLPATTNGPRVAASSSVEQNGGLAQSIFRTVLKTGLGTVSLVRLFAGLFGDGEAQAPPPLVKYAAPQAIHLERANRSSQDGRLSLAEFDYTQEGRQRLVSEPAPSSSIVSGEGHRWAERNAFAAGAPQITLNVQAMDSRSFLDHSHEIALAVREAMLNMHPLNDVVSDL